jgi:hypothetical protein
MSPVNRYLLRGRPRLRISKSLASDNEQIVEIQVPSANDGARSRDLETQVLGCSRDNRAIGVLDRVQVYELNPRKSVAYQKLLDRGRGVLVEVIASL